MELKPEFEFYAARMQEEIDKKFGRVAMLWTAEQTEIVLQMYSLYKQGTLGDTCIPRPWMIDVAAYQKWLAWSKLQGMSKEQAMRQYIVKAKELLESK